MILIAPTRVYALVRTKLASGAPAPEPAGDAIRDLFPTADDAWTYVGTEAKSQFDVRPVDASVVYVVIEDTDDESCPHNHAVFASYASAVAEKATRDASRERYSETETVIEVWEIAP